MAQEVVKVSVHIPGEKERFTPVGMMLKNDEQQVCAFIYFNPYIERKLPPIDPINLNYNKTGSRTFAMKKFGDMPDIFKDALPGSFGEKMIRKFEPAYKKMSDIDKLRWLGTRDVKGFRFQVMDRRMKEMPARNLEELDDFRQEVLGVETLVIETMDTKYIPELKKSDGGARPKWRLIDNQKQEWMCKFNEKFDPYNMAKMEFLTLEFMKKAGVDAPESKIATLPNSGEKCLLIKRFDYDEDNMRMHTTSLATFIGHENKACSDYVDLGDKIREVSCNPDRDMEQFFKSMLTDMFFNNTDNHAQNFDVMLTKDGVRLSPQFDKTPDPGGIGMTTTCCGLSSADISDNDFLDKAAEKFGISAERGRELRRDIYTAIKQLPAMIKEAGLDDKDRRMLAAAISRNCPGLADKIKPHIVSEETKTPVQAIKPSTPDFKRS